MENIGIISVFKFKLIWLILLKVLNFQVDEIEMNEHMNSS